MFGKKDAPLRCSFCGKAQGEVGKLIAGPSVYICDECIGVCQHILADDAGAAEGRPPEGAGGAPGPPPAGDDYAGSFICPKCRSAFALFPRPLRETEP